MSDQSYLLLMRTSPYSGHRPRAALDIALTAAAFEERVTVVFVDEGVLQLQTGQDTKASGMKNIGQMIPALHLYDVESLLVHSASAEKHGIQINLLDGVSPVDDAGLSQLLVHATQVMVF